MYKYDPITRSIKIYMVLIPSQLCEMCKATIPDQVKATSNRKYCPTCFSAISKHGINEAMKIRSNVSAQEASEMIKESDIRNLASGLAQPEDFADILIADITGVTERIYKRSGFTNPAKKSEVLNHLSKWALDMQITASDMGYVRCCECQKAFLLKDRIELSVSSEEMMVLSLPKKVLISCTDCYSKIKVIIDSVKGVDITKQGLDYNNLSLPKAIMMGGLNPYATAPWVISNPNCWKYIHPEQEYKYIGTLKYGDLIFMGNNIQHGA